MATLAKLLVQLGLDDAGFSKGLAGTKAKLNSWGQSLTTAGAAATAGLTLPILAGAGKAVMAASDLGEAVSATQTIYGKSAASVIAWGKTTANAYGISNAAALSTVNTLGQLYKGAGVTADQAGKFGMSIVGAAGDLASFYNLPTEQTLADLQSGLVGQYDPLRKYGIVLDEAKVAQRALNDTGKTSIDQLTDAEKVTARTALITEGLGDAQGDAARTANSLANIKRRLTARGVDLAAKWGKLLLPTVEKLGKFFDRLMTRLENLSPRMQKIAAVAAIVAAALGPVLLILGAMLPAFALLLGPVGLIIVAVGLLGAAFATNFLGIRDAAGAVISTMAALGKIFAMAFGEGISNKQLLDLFPDSLKGVAEGALKIVDAFGDLYRAFQDGGLRGLADALPGEIAQIWRGITDIASGVGSWFLGQLKKVPWISLLQQGFEVGSNVGMAFIAKLGSVTESIGRWAAQQFSRVPWGAIFDTAVSFGSDLAGKIAGKLKDLGIGLKQAYDQAIATIPFGELGRIAGSKVGDLTRTLAPKAWELISGMTTWIWQHKSDIGKAVLAAIVAVPVVLGYVGETLVPKAFEFLRGFVDGLNINWKVVGAWLKTVPDMIKSGFALAGTWLLTAGLSLFSGFDTGMRIAWWLVTSSISNAIAWIITQFVTSVNWLYQAGMDIITGLNNGLAAAWGSVTTSISGAIAWIITQFTSAGQWLVESGRSLISGLASGINANKGAVWDAIKDLIGGIPGKFWDLLKWAGGTFTQSVTSDGYQSTGSMSGVNARMAGISGGSGSGNVFNISIPIHGGTFNGADDLAEEVARKLIPAIAGAAGAHFSANGVG